MKIHIVAPKPLTYSPYDEDCTGAHNGDTVKIECPGGLMLVIKELRSGIGNSYEIFGKLKNRKTRSLVIYIDDDGELIHDCK